MKNIPSMINKIKFEITDGQDPGFKEIIGTINVTKKFKTSESFKVKFLIDTALFPLSVFFILHSHKINIVIEERLIPKKIIQRVGFKFHVLIIDIIEI